MNTKKKIISICLAVCLIAIAVTGFSLAYFTDNDSKTNIFTVGNVDIELVEPSWVEPETVLPGIEYAKDPTVNNIGTNDAYIRVNVTLTKANAFIAAAERHGITDLSSIFLGHDESKWTRETITEDKEADTITYSYYFNDVLPGTLAALATPAPSASDEIIPSSTGALFTSVKIPYQFTSEDMANIREFEIIITADAIQAEGFADVEAAFTAFDAQVKYEAGLEAEA